MRALKLLALIILGLALIDSFIIVGPGQRGVVVRLGAVSDRVLGEGYHLRIPFIESVVKMDVRIQKERTQTAACSKDLQDTHSRVALNCHIDPAEANWAYQNLKDDYTQRVIDPTVQEVVKAVTARYTAVELITQREKVREEIRDILRTRLTRYNIVVDDFAIVNFSFFEQFTAAIEGEQAAEQMALKAQRNLEWNGYMPQVTGSAMPFINLSQPNQ